ncbi:dGTP triphosphohydrolase [Terriglobus tenax]|uniref:dGTP triphosphohydrolase n=1 Tax=Terriglobus tenax TaxID=1111115 RepID=UPI0021DF4219|nr:dNTP triphosphohydrolase [Terriglobus tenax]
MLTTRKPYAVRGDAHDPLIQRKWPYPERMSRSPFERDRDRVVGSRAFRRLAGKTQVFSTRSGDHFRSRLTHTIEVAQIAREVASSLGLNVELAETLALVHDIGHPPFGHTGERALDHCLQEYGLRFDHNLHALRTVEHFEQRYAAHRGLNLTLGVREGIIKHSRDYKAEDHPDLAEYFLGQRPPLEAQIIDLVDEVAYLAADLDDGLESGILEVDDLRENLSIFRDLYDFVHRRHPGVEQKYLFHETLQWMQHRLTDDVIQNVTKQVEEIGIETLEQIRAYPYRIAVFSPEMEAMRLEEKKYLYEALYTCGPLKVENAHGRVVIESLFRYWVKNPSQLPEGYYGDLETEGVARTVADYIAGMTDTYILDLYGALVTKL